MNVLLTQAARADLGRIRERREEYSVESAQELIIALLRRLRQVRDYPRLGRVIPEFQHPDLREVLEQGFRITYQVFEEYVEVFGVVHLRQDIRPPS